MNDRERGIVLFAIEFFKANIEDDEMAETFLASDHALDALVCALVARAAALGLVESVPERDREAARLEGWMALPMPDALRRVAAAET